MTPFENFTVSNRRLDQLANAFATADLDQSGSIQYKEFTYVFELYNGPLARSLWAIYGQIPSRLFLKSSLHVILTCPLTLTDQDGDKDIDFIEFVTGLTETLQIHNTQEKVAWAFDLYDLNKDGTLQLVSDKFTLHHSTSSSL